MSNPPFVYQAVVVQYAATDGPDYVWANTHTFIAPAGFLGEFDVATAVAQAFATFHRSLLLPAYGVDRVVLGTLGPDLPLPAGFAVFPYRLAGTSNAGGRPLPLEVVAFIRKRVPRGKNGKMFLRGALTTNSIRAEEFATDAGVNFPSAFGQSSQALFSALDQAGVQLVVASGPVASLQTRPIISLEPVNARSLQYRTRRKTRLQANAILTIRDLLRDDGGFTADELPRLAGAIRDLLGRRWLPELPAP